MTPLVVFDLDGTLVDSRRDLANAANALVTELGGTPVSEQAVGDMVGNGAAMLVRRALAAAGLDAEMPGALPRFLELYDDRLLEHTRPYDGISDVLERLRPRATLAVLTNKPQAATDKLLAGLGLSSYFRHVPRSETGSCRSCGDRAALGIVDRRDDPGRRLPGGPRNGSPRRVRRDPGQVWLRIP
jgi:phosphoglycolate phosphatase